MAVDIFETENGIGVKPQSNVRLEKYFVACRTAVNDRNLRRRVARRLKKLGIDDFLRRVKRSGMTDRRWAEWFGLTGLRSIPKKLIGE